MVIFNIFLYVYQRVLPHDDSKHNFWVRDENSWDTHRDLTHQNKNHQNFFLPPPAKWYEVFLKNGVPPKKTIDFHMKNMTNIDKWSPILSEPNKMGFKFSIHQPQMWVSPSVNDINWLWSFFILYLSTIAPPKDWCNTPCMIHYGLKLVSSVGLLVSLQ